MNMMAWPDKPAWARGIGAAAVLVIALAAPAPARAAQGWQAIDTAEAGSGISAFHGLALDGAGNVWAGGSAERGLQIGTNEPHVEQLLHRWDGATWTAAPQPPQTQAAGSFRPQALASAGADMWVVGTRIQRYVDGQWTVYPHDSTSAFNQLQAVAALSQTNVWAVGRQTTGALIEHWDGIRWTQFPVANLSGGDLMAIEALAPDDIWAVGRNGSASLTMHWDGRFWSVAPPTSPASRTRSCAGSTRSRRMTSGPWAPRAAGKPSRCTGMGGCGRSFPARARRSTRTSSTASVSSRPTTCGPSAAAAGG